MAAGLVLQRDRPDVRMRSPPRRRGRVSSGMASPGGCFGQARNQRSYDWRSAQTASQFFVAGEPTRRFLRERKSAVDADFEDATAGSAETDVRRRSQLEDEFPRRTGARLISSMAAIFDLDLHELNLATASLRSPYQKTMATGRHPWLGRRCRLRYLLRGPRAESSQITHAAPRQRRAGAARLPSLPLDGSGGLAGAADLLEIDWRRPCGRMSSLPLVSRRGSGWRGPAQETGGG
jgi:hypothetical protein